MAQQLLENPLLQEATGALEADLLQQMYVVDLADNDAHTRLILALQTSKALTRHLWRTVQDGAQASEQINLRGSRID